MIDLELARHWNAPAALKSIGSPCNPNPVLDEVIPSLFYLRAASLLDEALGAFIDEADIAKGRGFREDLHHRIVLLAQRGVIEDLDRFLGLKDMRNRIAHEGAHATWVELSDTVELIESLLVKMDYVDRRPILRFYAERSAYREVRAPGVLGERDICYGLTEGEKKVIEVKWTERFMDDDQ